MESRTDIDAYLSRENKRYAHTIFDKITKNTTIILVYKGKIKGLGLGDKVRKLYHPHDVIHPYCHFKKDNTNKHRSSIQPTVSNPHIVLSI